MKRFYILSLLYLTAMAIAGQNNLVVKYRVLNHDSDWGDLVEKEMTLVANANRSLYFNAMSLYVDSCKSTPEGAARLREIQMKAWRVEQPDGTVTYDGRKLGLAPDKSVYLYVEKNSDKDILTVYDFKADELCQYSEPLAEMTWTLEDDSTKNILGFECFPAHSDYHGRRWSVWYAPELPVHDGPWKLHGLPGVILSADGGDGFIIEAKEVGVTAKDIPQVYSVSEYEKGERRKILADHEHFENNFEALMSAEGLSLNADGSPADIPKYNRNQRAWETDY